MALIVEQHVVADRYQPAAATTAGMLVEFTTAGTVTPAVAGNNAAVGVAGDSWLSSEGKTTAYSDNVVIGANSSTSSRTRFTENRISDFYDETKASGLITVYHGGGKFWISSDLFDSDGSAISVGDQLSVGTTNGEWGVTASNTVGDFIGIAASTASAYPSGVPGTDITGSITLGDYVAVALRI